MAENIIIQAQSTQFERRGNTRQVKEYFLPFNLRSYLSFAYAYTGVGLNLSAAEQNYLYKLLTQDTQVLPGGCTLRDVQEIVEDVFPGAAELQAIYRRDPYSDEYETNTAAQYDRQYATARAAAQSGPTNVRGGTVRVAFETAELGTQMALNRFREIWQNQMTMAQIVIGAIGVANQIGGERRRARLQSVQLQAATEQGRVVQGLGASEQLSKLRNDHQRAMAAGSEFLGAPVMNTVEDLAGQGSGQSATMTSFGASYWR
jgi:hypothetical protein